MKGIRVGFLLFEIHLLDYGKEKFGFFLLAFFGPGFQKSEDIVNGLGIASVEKSKYPTKTLLINFDIY